MFTFIRCSCIWREPRDDDDDAAEYYEKDYEYGNQIARMADLQIV